MPYISEKLCHFVGRSMKDDGQRFGLLCKIIRKGQLLVNPRNPTGEPVMKLESTYRVMDELGEPYSHIDCVCFCDIPDDELKIHTSKYSKFGLGFKKEFLAKQGAKPVMYVPRGIKIEDVKSDIIPKDSEAYFIELNRLFAHTGMLLAALDAQSKAISRELPNALKINPVLDAYFNENMQEFKDEHGNLKFNHIIFTLMNAFMSLIGYVKVFNMDLSEEDEKNYYMEREWRSLNNISFTMDDIESVYFPENEMLSEMFIESFPQLKDKMIYLP